jgi:DNA-binding NarL/FixJ family response regulator
MRFRGLINFINMTTFGKAMEYGLVRLMTKIMLADDHLFVRKELKSLLSTEKDFEIIGEASDGRAALELANRLQPDILILDLMMPEMSGLEVAERLAKICPQTRIVVLSMQRTEAYIQEAFHCGSSAYVLKEDAPNELITAIRRVIGGECYFSSSLPVKSVEDLQNW